MAATGSPCSRPSGDRFHVSGEFLEIDPPSRLAYTFRWDEPTPDDRETVVTLTVAAPAGPTELSLRQGEFATEERLALAPGRLERQPRQAVRAPPAGA